MHAIVAFTLVPVGAGLSVSPYVAVIERILEKSGLNFEVNCNGTNIEGSWDRVFEVLEQCHLAVHQAGAPRIHTCIQVGTRTDRDQLMADKLQSIVDKRPQ